MKVKVKAKFLVVHDGKVFEPGTEFDIPQEAATPLLERGVVEVVEEKEEKGVTPRKKSG